MTSLVLHRVGRATAHAAAGAIAAAALGAWTVFGVVVGFPGWWENALYIVSGAVTLVLLFALQHTQARDETALQLKLDEVLRALPRADGRLIAAEEAPDAQLGAAAQRGLEDRRGAVEAAQPSAVAGS